MPDRISARWVRKWGVLCLSRCVLANLREVLRSKVEGGDEASRKSYKSTLILAANLLAEPKKEMQCKVVLACMDPIMKAHGKELKNIRGSSATLQYNIAFALGTHWTVFRNVFMTTQSASTISSVGLAVGQRLVGMCDSSAFASSASGGRSSAAAALSRQVAIEEDVAGDWWHLVCALVKHRLLATAHWSHSYPGSFAALLSDSPTIVAGALRKAREAWEAIMDAEARRHDSIAVQSLLKAHHSSTCVHPTPVGVAFCGFGQRSLWFASPGA